MTMEQVTDYLIFWLSSDQPVKCIEAILVLFAIIILLDIFSEKPS